MIDINKQDLTIYRTISLGGALLIPLFSIIYRITNPDAYDPFLLRTSMSLLALVVFGCTYIDKFKNYLTTILYTLFYLALAWFMYLLYHNQFNANYFVGFIIVIYVSMLGFKKPMHLLYYFVVTMLSIIINIYALNTRTEVSPYLILITTSAMFGVFYFILSSKCKYQDTIQKANEQLLVKNKEITDSISYARRIQSAMLSSTDLIFQALTQSFILFKPKDVVSGDFYAFAEQNGVVVIAAVDCTGHGVPGAFMSLIGHNILSQIIIEQSITNPVNILERLNDGVRKALKQEETNTNDGMDICLCTLNLKTYILEYAGANRPLWIVSNGELKEIKPTKSGIGGSTEIPSFELHTVQLKKDDTIYLFSDGYVDQFGGTDEKKFMTKRFKETLIGIQHKNMKEQGNTLNKVFEEWKGKNEQVDDVLVMGVKI
jgi:serine phosphatase RsbU (regulator of sigma subunit)